METQGQTVSRRELLMHDALAFLSLTAITVVLFFITLFLFRSFKAHRAALAVEWAAQGQKALQDGRAEDAVQAYRTALTFAPGDHEDELVLAHALDAAGHTDEAYNYFLGFWDAQPGDSSINLQLGRLAAKRGDARTAVTYYHGAIDGSWDSDAVVQRRGARMELAQYLIAQHNNGAARVELMLAGNDAPGDPALQMRVAQLLNEAGDPGDAFVFYQRASPMGKSQVVLP